MFTRKKNPEGEVACPESSRKRIGAQVTQYPASPGPDTPPPLLCSPLPLHLTIFSTTGHLAVLPAAAPSSRGSAAHVTLLYSARLALRPPPHPPPCRYPSYLELCPPPHTSYWHSFELHCPVHHTQTHHGPKQTASKRHLYHVTVPAAVPGVTAEPSP